MDDNTHLFKQARRQILAALDVVSKTKQTGSGEFGHTFFNLPDGPDYMEIHFLDGVLHSISFTTAKGSAHEAKCQKFIAETSEN